MNIENVSEKSAGKACRTSMKNISPNLVYGVITDEVTLNTRSVDLIQTGDGLGRGAGN